jgi:isopentenyl-diphosphate delta-isomerase
VEKVILVDKQDNEIGTEEKMKAHSNGGQLHRAISVFLFNDKGETLLQQRASTKYHSKAKWANTCCSHPRPGEANEAAAERRLVEEMGIKAKLEERFVFPYHAEVGSGLTEQEYDHIFFGRYNEEPKPNKDEVQGWRWVSIKEFSRWVKERPEDFAAWVVLMADRFVEEAKKY